MCKSVLFVVFFVFTNVMFAAGENVMVLASMPPNSLDVEQRNLMKPTAYALTTLDCVDIMNDRDIPQEMESTALKFVLHNFLGCAFSLSMLSGVLHDDSVLGKQKSYLKAMGVDSIENDQGIEEDEDAKGALYMSIETLSKDRLSQTPPHIILRKACSSASSLNYCSYKYWLGVFCALQHFNRRYVKKEFTTNLHLMLVGVIHAAQTLTSCRSGVNHYTGAYLNPGLIRLMDEFPLLKRVFELTVRFSADGNKPLSVSEIQEQCLAVPISETPSYDVFSRVVNSMIMPENQSSGVCFWESQAMSVTRNTHPSAGCSITLTNYPLVWTNKSEAVKQFNKIADDVLGGMGADTIKDIVFSQGNSPLTLFMLAMSMKAAQPAQLGFLRYPKHFFEGLRFYRTIEPETSVDGRIYKKDAYDKVTSWICGDEKDVIFVQGFQFAAGLSALRFLQKEGWSLRVASSTTCFPEEYVSMLPNNVILCPVTVVPKTLQDHYSLVEGMFQRHMMPRKTDQGFAQKESYGKYQSAGSGQPCTARAAGFLSYIGCSAAVSANVETLLSAWNDRKCPDPQHARAAMMSRPLNSAK